MNDQITKLGEKPKTADLHILIYSIYSLYLVRYFNNYVFVVQCAVIFFLWVVFVNKWHVHVCKYKKQISHHGNELKNIACCSFTLSNNKLT
jgi:hypothetical protein